MHIKIKILTEGVQAPAYAHEGDCGLDIRASGNWIVNLDDGEKEVSQESILISPGERIVAKTGIALEMPPGTWGNIRDRSGLARKSGIHTMSGVLDENYRGELQLVLINLGKRPYEAKKGERLAQLIVSPYTRADIVIVDALTDTKRGSGGFGHSGKF
jgi:dUTP pyrophosphatase